MKNILFTAAVRSRVFLLATLILFAACSHSHDHQHDHEGGGHGHSHDTNLPLSGYTDRYEFFAEAEPFATGKSSDVTLYLSELKDYTPATIPSITICLQVGETETCATAEEGETPGVYHFHIQPEATGDAKLLFRFASEGEPEAEIGGITIYDDAHKAEHLAEELYSPSEDAIHFPKTTQWKTRFATEQPRMEPFGEVIRTTAQVQSSQTDETVISARTTGIVLFSGSAVTDGQPVRSGQPLFKISGSGLSDNNLEVRFAEINAAFERSKAEYERAKLLVDDRIVSQKEFADIRSRYETDKAAYDNIVRNFSRNGQQVSSPMNGFVRQLFVTNGSYVEEGQALLTVSNNRSLQLRADVRPKYAPLLPLISSATVRTGNAYYSLEELNGKLLSYGKSLSDGNYLLPVLFRVDHRPGLLPGGLVEIAIRTQSDRPVLTVPTSAITEEQGLYFLYVQNNPESFEKREVTIGATDGIRTEIRSGLDLSERIVSQGSISLKLALSTGTLDPHAGHVH